MIRESDHSSVHRCERESTSMANDCRGVNEGAKEERRGGGRSWSFLSLRIAYLVTVLFHLASVTMETSEFPYSNATDDGGGRGGGPQTSAEVCQMEAFQASCPEESPIIIVQEAHLGRLKLGRCVTESFGFLGCSLDVLPEMDVYCSGRSRCEVKVDDTSFKRKVFSCHKDLKNYLQVTYRCIKVILPTPNCDPIEVPSGFLSSQITESTGCGLTNTPWIVQVGVGQRINVTLYDFSHDAATGSGGGGGGELAATPSSHQTFPRTCRVYATIRDSSSSSVRSLKMCGWQGRILNVYASSGHRIEIRIMSGKTMATTTSRPNDGHQHQQQQHNPQFLLYFEAVGCPDIRVPDSMRKQRHGNTVTVSCHGNDLSWQLVCSDNRWVGSYGNCDVENQTNGPGLHYAASTVILVVIAAIVSSLILIIGVFCIKWRKREVDNARRLQLTTCPYATGDYALGAVSPDKLTPDSTNFVAATVASVGDTTGNEYARMRIMCLPQYDVRGPPAYDVDARYGTPTVEHIYESPDCLSGQSPDGRRVYAMRLHQPIRGDADIVTKAGSASSTRPTKVNLTQGRTGASTTRQSGTKSKTGGNYSL